MLNTRLYFTFLLLFVATHLASAQEYRLGKGAVTDSIPVSDKVAESFAVYLPQNFSEEKKWPVIFVFDPEGRGMQAALLFRKAAEEQGYIIAASNSFQYAVSMEEHMQTGARMMDRVIDAFPVDKENIYVAGIDQGAQVASALPFAFSEIDGVLAVGDVWIKGRLPEKTVPWMFTAIVGYHDHNLYQVEKAVRAMTRVGHPTLLYKIPQGEGWPDPGEISAAVAGFTLRAMLKDSTSIDQGFIDRLYHEELEIVERLRRSLQPYKAYERLEQMEIKYAAFKQKEEILSRKKELGNSKQFKKQRRQYRAAARKEIDLKIEYPVFLEEDLWILDFGNLGWWQKEIEKLDKYEKQGDPAWAEMSSRVKGYLHTMARNTYNELKAAKAGIDHLVYTAILQTIFAKENPEGYMKVISLSARAGDYDIALLYLEDLLKTGYKDMEAIYNIPGTLDLRLSPEFNHLIKEYLGESRYYDKPGSEPENTKD